MRHKKIKKLEILKFSKRHVFKSFTWRLIGTLDTFILSWLITGDSALGLKISGFELITKTLLYYFHDLFWFKSKFTNASKRHIIKTFTWRFIGTLDTVLIAWLISGSPLSGLKIGSLEIFSKMLLYFGHEKLWYRINYGLDLKKRGVN